MEYLVLPMLEDASALLGDFVTLYQEQEVHRMQFAYMEQRVKMSKGAVEIEANLLLAEVAGLKQGLTQAQREKEQFEQKLKEARLTGGGPARPTNHPRQDNQEGWGSDLLPSAGGEVRNGTGCSEEAVGGHFLVNCPPPRVQRW